MLPASFLREALRSLKVHEEVTMKRKFKFDDYELNNIIKALIELRNQLIEEGRYTDAVDDLLLVLCK